MGRRFGTLGAHYRYSLCADLRKFSRGIEARILLVLPIHGRIILRGFMDLHFHISLAQAQRREQQKERSDVG